MAKKKNDDTTFYENLALETKGELLENLSKVVYFIDTGNLAVNWICSGKFINGGIPGGKICEVFGPEASGKSLWGYRLLSAIQQMGGVGVYLDCERAINPNFVKAVGKVDTSKTLVYCLPTFDQIETKVIQAVTAIRKHKGKEIPILFVWDSIGVTMTEREWHDVENAKDSKETTKEQPGERAKKAGGVLRKLNPFLDDNNATLYIVNQQRSKVGVIFGDPNTTSGGGKALPYYASLRLAMGVQKKIEDKVLEMPVGINLRVAVKKNRSFTPFLETHGVQLYFDQGINPLGGLLSALINSRRVRPSGKGNYVVQEPWAGGKEIKFKASKERNDVPMSLLFDCPAVVDATSEDELRTYLGTFAEAIELSTNEDITEIDVDMEGTDVSELVSPFSE
jgi:recombination protein RecA